VDVCDKRPKLLSLWKTVRNGWWPWPAWRSLLKPPVPAAAGMPSGPGVLCKCKCRGRLVGNKWSYFPWAIGAELCLWESKDQSCQVGQGFHEDWWGELFFVVFAGSCWCRWQQAHARAQLLFWFGLLISGPLGFPTVCLHLVIGIFVSFHLLLLSGVSAHNVGTNSPVVVRHTPMSSSIYILLVFLKNTLMLWCGCLWLAELSWRLG
jgi:hypothetical protein